MLRFGVDVLILVSFALLLTVLSYLVCRFMQVTEDVGSAVVKTTGIVSSLMVLAYVLMFKLLDAIMMMS